MARPEPVHRRRRTGAGLEEALGAAFAEAQAERLQVADQAQISLLLGADQQIGQSRAGEQLLLAALQRAEARGESRLGGKGGEQALCEGVDGLDAQAPAPRLEHAGEQGARLIEAVGIVRLAQAEQLLAKLRILEPYPEGEPLVDSLGHLGGPGFGEGQAEDRRGIGPRQQQPKDPRGEHVSLAGSGRGRKSGMVARRRGAQLVAFKSCEGLQAIGHTGR